MIESGNRLEFMRFLADLSTRLVALPANQVDDAIQQALVQCLEYFKIDRLSLLKLLPDRMSFMVVCVADISGTDPYAGATMTTSLVPWVSKKLINGEIVSFARHRRNRHWTNITVPKRPALKAKDIRLNEDEINNMPRSTSSMEFLRNP